MTCGCQSFVARCFDREEVCLVHGQGGEDLAGAGGDDDVHRRTVEGFRFLETCLEDEEDCVVG